MEIRQLRPTENGGIVPDQLTATRSIPFSSEPDAPEWIAEVQDAFITWIPQQIDTRIRSNNQSELAPGMALLWLEGSLLEPANLKPDQATTEFTVIADTQPKTHSLYTTYAAAKSMR